MAACIQNKQQSEVVRWTVVFKRLFLTWQHHKGQRQPVAFEYHWLGGHIGMLWQLCKNTLYYLHCIFNHKKRLSEGVESSSQTGCAGES